MSQNNNAEIANKKPRIKPYFYLFVNWMKLKCWLVLGTEVRSNGFSHIFF